MWKWSALASRSCRRLKCPIMWRSWSGCAASIWTARKTSGNGFYYLRGDIARLHSAILSYARDFMIDRGFNTTFPRL